MVTRFGKISLHWDYLVTWEWRSYSVDHILIANQIAMDVAIGAYFLLKNNSVAL